MSNELTASQLLEQSHNQSKSNSSLSSLSQQFIVNDPIAEQQFKASTVGLVTAEEYKQKKAQLQELHREAKNKITEASNKHKLEKEKQRKAQLNKLSFAAEEEEEEEQEEGGEEQKESQPQAKKPRLFQSANKNPDVDTHFLPDNVREAATEQLKLELEEKWQQEQELIQAAAIEITYSYWNGSGHRKKTNITKGSSIWQFLKQAREECMTEFPELRALAAKDLMYIKEDIILPLNCTFYELILSKARGKSGPLFHFDAREDIRVESNARVEKDESHAGKVVTKAWYEKNKHTFPASRWELYDQNKNFEKYTIHGSEVNNSKK
jgi:protein FAM50